MAVKTSKILKVAGLSFVGFCAVSIGVDKANIGPVASQLAGFCGAFVGGWVGSRRRHKRLVAAPAVPLVPEVAPSPQPEDDLSKTTR